MQTHVSPAVSVEAPHSHPSSIRWSAVAAGLAVGMGLHLLLMLVGLAAGLAVYGSGERPEGGSVSITAAVWNGASMLISAFFGGYIAARGCGLRRNADGVLHGVTAWGASMLLFAWLAASVSTGALSGAFGIAAGPGLRVAPNPASSLSALIDDLERGNRAGAEAVLRGSFGLNAEQASRLAARATALADAATDGASSSSGAVRRELDAAVSTASAAGAWLSLVILVSMLAAAGGGVMGATGNLIRSLPGAGSQRRESHRAQPSTR